MVHAQGSVDKADIAINPVRIRRTLEYSARVSLEDETAVPERAVIHHPEGRVVLACEPVFITHALYQIARANACPIASGR